MIKKIVSISILIAFSFSFLAQSKMSTNFSNKNVQHLTKTSFQVSTPALLDFDCGDCDSSDCDHQDDHCAHHCPGLHNIALNVSIIVLQIPTNINVKSRWYRNNHYKTPFLDPALKPPMHS